MNNNQIKAASILSYSVILFNIIIGLLYTPWMVNKIGRSDYGLYILVTTFLTYFVVDFGMWQAINKIICQYRAEKKDKEIKNVIGQALKIYLSLDAIVCIVLIFVYFNIDYFFTKLTPEELIKFKHIFLIAAAASILSFPLNFFNGVMMAHEYFVQLKLFEFTNKILLISLTVLCLFLGYGLYSLVAVYGFVPLILNIAKVIYLYSKGVRCNFSYFNKSLIKNIIGLSIWLFIIVLAELFINNVSPSILAAFSGTEQIAVFAIGLTIYGYVYAFAGALNGLFLPKISKLIANAEFDEIEQATFRVERIQFLIIGFIILGIILTGQTFITAWMGPYFNNSYYVALFLVIPGFVFLGQAIESTHLFALNKIKYRSICMLITAITSVVISIILAPGYGAIGVAIGICIGNAIGMVICLNIVYYKVLNFNIKRYIKTLIHFLSLYVFIAFITYMCSELLFEERSLMIWHKFMIQVFIYILVYSVFMWFVGMNSYEKSLITRFATKIKTKIK